MEKLNPNKHEGFNFALDSNFDGKETVKRLVNIAIVYTTLPSILVVSCASQTQLSQSNCKIVIERPEENGAINLCSCIVRINSGQEIILSGGETNSFSIAPGRYFLTATSSNPYPTVTKDSDWKSRPIKIKIEDSQMVKIIVEPKSEGSTYVGGWVLQQK